MKFYVCSCLFDLVMLLKSNFEIKIFIDLAEENGIMRPNIFFTHIENDFFICCKKTIDFIAKNDSNLYNDCMAVCPHEYCHFDSVNCLDLFKFGFEDFCDECLKLTTDCLSRSLNEIEK